MMNKVSKGTEEKKTLTDLCEKIQRKCIDCGRCTKHCDFLTKYDLNLKDFTKRPDLAKSCFLCDRCLNVCPKNLSGRELALAFREAKPEKTRKVRFLKQNYVFQNNSGKKSETLLFLGCNYPGYYPKTCEKLMDLCQERGIDYSVDCCKKPVVEQGEEGNFRALEELLAKKETRRLICACPNCYHLLRQKLNVEVISPYQFLREEGLGAKISKKIPIFFPCSDRYGREIFQDIQPFLEEGHSEPFASVNCCGLGGGAGQQEPDLVQGKMDRLRALDKEGIYTYCSSCSGIFGKYQLPGVRNILSEILGVQEEVAPNYGINVIKFKMKGRNF